MYEILVEHDPLEENDCEIEDAVEMYTSGMRRFDEPTSAVDEPTKEVNVGTEEDPRLLTIASSLPPEEAHRDVKGV